MLIETSEMAGTRLLGLDAAASYLNINLQTVRRLMERGVLQPVRIPTLRRVLFDRQDLDTLIEAGKSTPNRAECAVSLVGIEIGDHVEV
jgi:excisionase family DNA binding protein